MLALTVTAPGDFSTYQLAIASSTLDPFFATRRSRSGGLRRRPWTAPRRAAGRPRAAAGQVPIDYLAKDFGSFAQALSEFSVAALPGMGGAVGGRPRRRC